MGEEQHTQKSVSAKEVSKWSMAIAGVWIAGMSVVKAFFRSNDFGLTVDEIIKTGIALAAIFSPVYLSIVLDKIRDIKIGGGK